jgi:hypothetical protein
MYSDATAACPALACIGSTRYERSTQLTRDARSSATVSTVLVVTGGAAILAAAAVYLTRPDPRERSAARLVPVVDDRSAGLAIVGRF